MEGRAGSSTAMPSAYKYEPRPRTGKSPPKHKWNKPHADFIERKGGEIEGMCPHPMCPSTLNSLLNDGLKDFGHSTGEHPRAIFNVYQGVPYKAYVTQQGISYHGFPCRKSDVPPRLFKSLLALANDKKCKNEVERWFKDHV